MSEKKSALGEVPARPELDRLVKEALAVGVTEDELREQRISFAYGNAPESDRITKDTVRGASRSMRMAAA